MILADLQWRLYDFGHSLDPKAPIRLKPFTPLVIGETAMGNFISSAMISWGFLCIVAAAGALLLAGCVHSPVRAPPRRHPRAASDGRRRNSGVGS